MSEHPELHETHKVDESLHPGTDPQIHESLHHPGTDSKVNESLHPGTDPQVHESLHHHGTDETMPEDDEMIEGIPNHTSGGNPIGERAMPNESSGGNPASTDAFVTTAPEEAEPAMEPAHEPVGHKPVVHDEPVVEEVKPAPKAVKKAASKGKKK